MRRIALVLAIAVLAAVGLASGEAKAQCCWSALPGGGYGSSPQAVCEAWGAYYDGYCKGITGVAYNLSGRPSGYYYAIWDGIGPGETLNELTNPACPYPMAADLFVASGCSAAPPPTLKQLGNTPPGRGCLCGDPINIVTGNMFETVTDYESAGPDKLRFVRYYNSQAQYQSYLGVGWQSNYDRAIHFDLGTASSATSLHVVRPDGAVFHFTKSNGVWTSADNDVDATLTTDGATTWTFTGSDDTVETYAFSSGQLLSITTRSGYTRTLQYANGLPSSVTDSYGRTLTFTFANGVLSTMIDPDGQTYSYGYTSVVVPNPNLLVSVAYPGSAPNPTVQYLYEDTTYPTAMTGVIDENGNRYATWAYDTMDRAVSSQHAGGADAMTVSYDLNSLGTGTVTVTNALGEQTIDSVSWIDNLPRLTQLAEQASASTQAATSTIGYDGNGYVSEAVDNNGNTTTYTNDSRGLVLTETEASGTALARTTTTAWLGNFHLPTEIVEPGRTTGFTYDGSGRLLTRTDTDTTSATVPYSTNGQTRSWSWTWSATGEVLSATDPLNDTTSYAYDASGALVSVTNALGQVTQVTSHDASGRPLTVVDANNATTTLAYDPRGRLLSVTAPGGATTTLAYDAAGNLIQITRPDGSFLAYTYDAAHRLVSVADAFGDAVNYTLDALGDRTAEQIDASGGALVKTQSRIFDELGRLIQSIGAASETTSYAYDKDGNETGVTDPLSNLTSRSFDALNRLIKIAAPLSSTTGFAYDAHDNRTGVTDPRGLATGYVYDGLDDLIQVSSPDTGVAIYQVDAAGHRIEATDAAGNVVQMSYDPLGRITARTYPNDPAENVTYRYDEAAAVNGVGRLTSVGDESGSTGFVYDARGNVVQETQVIGGLSYTTSYAYDLADHVAQITYPSGRIVSYSRDGMGRVTAIATAASANAAPAAVVSGASYLPFGPLASLSYGNGLVLAIQYDQDYRPSARLVSGAATVQDLTYGYDADSDVTAIADVVDPARSQSFQYDVLQRLISATGLYGALSYGYDAVGNRLSESGGDTNLAASYGYAGNSNELLSVTNGGATRSLGYTGAGNLAVNDNGTGTVLNFAYNQQNRLVQVASQGATVAAYQQDYTGARVAKLAGGVSTQYHYDRAGHLLAESDGNTGAAGTEYLWLDDLPVAMVEGGAVYFIHPDHLGTPQRITDANQNLVWDAVLRPFGAAEQLTATFTANLRFPSQYADAETGLDYNFFRDYDPTIGRYIESDPIGLAGGVNTYAYVNSAPMTYTDPDGLQLAVPVPTPPPPWVPDYRIPYNAQLPSWIKDLFKNPLAQSHEQMSTPGEPPSTAGSDTSSTGKMCKASSEDRKRCDDQLYNIDLPVCDAVGRRRGKVAYRRCEKTAMERYAACLAGRPLPPLDVWNN